MSDTHNVNESNEKVRLKTQVKRGEGTRDQDTHDLKVRAETPEDAAERLSTVLRELEQRDVFERTRNVGNGGNDYDDHRLANAEPATVPDDAERDAQGEAVFPDADS